MELSDSQIQEWRSHFPILNSTVYGKPLIYLDNAATTQKPLQVINAISDYYRNFNSNIHRGVHALSQKSTDLFENSRQIVAKFINAYSTDEIIFTKSATEGFNLLASSFSQQYLQKGDEIILTMMEHHANIVPWQIHAKHIGFTIKVLPLLPSGELDLDVLLELISEKTKLISCIYVSNALGLINPVEKIISIAKQHSIPIVIDASQAIQHMHIDVQALDCDFLVFSGHKIYSPSGTGIVYGKRKYLEEMPPYQGGGDMIRKVSFEKTTFAEIPSKFEAGTPNIEGFVGLGSGISFIQDIGFEKISLQEQCLLSFAQEELQQIPEVKIVGESVHKTAVISFTIDDIHPHDIATLLDRSGIAVRAGHHCAQPIMQHFNIPATTRASFAFYNTIEEVNYFIQHLKHIIMMFK